MITVPYNVHPVIFLSRHVAIAIITFLLLASSSYQHSSTNLSAMFWPQASYKPGHPIVQATCISPLRGSFIRWLKDGHPLIRDERIIVENEADFSTLKIRRLKTTDRGNYTCAVMSGSSDILDSSSSTLSIQEPPRWLDEPSDINTVLGKRVVVRCRGDPSSSPSPVSSWTPVGQDSHKQLPVDFNNSLIFSTILISDAGRYECRVSNGVGDDLVKVVTIRVNGSCKVLELCLLPTFLLLCVTHCV